jgi:RNA polymerase sigma-70 factor (ECF subfamily)
VFRTAWLILGDPEDARDAAQSGFLKAWVAIGDVDPARPFQPWLITIVANEARNRRRARRRWLARVLPEDRIELLTAPEPPPDQDVAQRDEAERILRELTQMDETDRMTLWCRYVLGLGEQETADVLACAVGTVKSRTHRAIERLRARLRDAGVLDGTEGGERDG